MILSVRAAESQPTTQAPCPTKVVAVRCGRAKGVYLRNALLMNDAISTNGRSALQHERVRVRVRIQGKIRADCRLPRKPKTGFAVRCVSRIYAGLARGTFPSGRYCLQAVPGIVYFPVPVPKGPGMLPRCSSAVGPQFPAMDTKDAMETVSGGSERVLRRSEAIRCSAVR